MDKNLRLLPVLLLQRGGDLVARDLHLGDGNSPVLQLGRRQACEERRIRRTDILSRANCVSASSLLFLSRGRGHRMGLPNVEFLVCAVAEKADAVPWGVNTHNPAMV